ncbi:apolipoprotein N-acyltransferase [Demequina pelophila]|uniref:apolipoprotein N-acyltransferase n=1 Tax=Demequina pelophila TaxID=1638984 RepID=UPI0007829A29|nr:apolipoprotein N-acyltransferase [Demequina pelophila]
MTGLRNLLLAAVSGFALDLAFPDTGWWPLAILAIAGLWWSLERVTAWSAFALGTVFGTAFFLPHLAWADFAVGLVPWLALSVVEGAFIGLAAAGWAHVRRSGMLKDRPWSTPVVFALIWTGAEQLRGMVPFGGFPWGRLGYALVDAPVARLAWAGGVPLVTFAVALAGAALGFGFEALRTRRFLVAAVAPVAAVGVLAVGYLVPLDAQAQEGTMHVAAVQGNVPDRGLDSFNQAREVTKNHVAETERVAESGATVDLLVWPENAADIDPRVDGETMADVTRAAQAVDAPILLGTVDYTPEDGRYNTSLLMSTQGAVLDTYSKQRPAPFAEYIPLRDIARQVTDVVDRVTDMLAGTEVAVMDAPVESLGRTVRVGSVICFEVAYDSIVRESVASGAEFLVVQTNNATFGRTAESTQQLQMSRLRAIETGRWTIQDSTVGVSAVIDSRGHVIAQTELFEAAHMVERINLRSEITPAVRIGFFLGWAALLVPAAIVLLAMRRRVLEAYDW